MKEKEIYVYPYKFLNLMAWLFASQIVYTHKKNDGKIWNIFRILD